MKCRRIWGNESTSRPSQMGVVHVSSTVRPRHDKTAPLVESFFSVSAAVWRWECDLPSRVQSIEGGPVSGFWEWIAQHTSKRRSTWLWIVDVPRAIRLLQVPEMLESGDLMLYMRHSSTPTLQITSETNSISGGAWIDGDPPTVLSLQTSLMGLLTILDTANWIAWTQQQIKDWSQTPRPAYPTFVGWPDEFFSAVPPACLPVARLVCAISSWVSDENLGQLRTTVASQGMAAYRHRFADTAGTVDYAPDRRGNRAPRRRRWVDPQPHSERAVHWLELASYYGGRVDCFYLGEMVDNLAQIDVVSAYPTVMSQIPLPYRLRRWYLTDEPYRSTPDIDPARSIALVGLWTNENEYPCRWKDGVYYLAGRFQTVLCGPELARAVAAGEVAEWYSWAEYDCRPWLADFADWTMLERRRADENHDCLLSVVTKSMANSVYGKWAQRLPSWAPQYDRIAPTPWRRGVLIHFETGEQIQWRSIGWSMEYYRHNLQATASLVNGIVVTPADLIPDPRLAVMSFPAASAWIAADLRMRMDRIRLLCGTRTVLYQHTDCLFVVDRSRDIDRRLKDDEFTRIAKVSVRGRAPSMVVRGNNSVRFGQRNWHGPVRDWDGETPDETVWQQCRERLGSLWHRTADGTYRLNQTAYQALPQQVRRIPSESGWTTPIVVT